MMEITYCPNEFQLANGFTKIDIFQLWGKLGLISLQDNGLNGLFSQLIHNIE